MHFLKKKINDYEHLYNKIISLTREKFFYTEILVKDEFITRLYLILIHLAFILKLLKKDHENKKISQNIYDFFFRNIELQIREIGYGDVSVNKKMKELIILFHEILINCNKWNDYSNIQKSKFLNDLFDENNKKKLNIRKLFRYFDNFSNNIEYISLNSLIKGIISIKK